MATTADAPTFHPFPRLPTELRLEIWALAIPSAFLDPDRTCDMLIYEDWNYQNGFQIIRNGEHPALFDVNREARAEIARIDGGRWCALNLSDSADGPQIYINPKVTKKVTFYSYRVHGPGICSKVWQDFCVIALRKTPAGSVRYEIVEWDWERNWHMY